MIAPDDIVPVILAGSGVTGLRPIAGTKRPPPFLRLHARRSFFQDALLRGSLFARPVIVCQDTLIDLVRKQMEEVGIRPAAIIAEPARMGTAAAVSMASFHLKNKGKLMLVMPSDHVINDHGIFQKNVLSCAQDADRGILMLGTAPAYAESQYDYIRHSAVKLGQSADVLEFHEKPDRKQAGELINDPHMLWNTGIFMARPRHYLDALQIYAGDIYRNAQRAYFAAQNNADTVYPQAEEFAKIRAASVEHVIMKNCEELFVYDLKMRWSDAGTWKRLLRLKIAAKR